MMKPALIVFLLLFMRPAMIMHETAQHLAEAGLKIVEFPYDSKVAINDPLNEEQNHDEASLDRVPALIHEAGDDHARNGAAPRRSRPQNSGLSI